MRSAPRRSAGRRPAEPTSPSPPQTPTTASPTNGRKLAPEDRMASKQSPSMIRHGVPPKNIIPLGGNRFSYLRSQRPEDISPCSSQDSEEEDEDEDEELEDAEDEEDEDDDSGSDESEDEEEEDEEDEEEEDDEEEEEVQEEEAGLEGFDSPPRPPVEPLSDFAHPPPFALHTHTTKIIIAEDRLVIEDLGEYYVHKMEDGEIMKPCGYEDPDDQPPVVLQQPPARKGLDPAFRRKFEDLNPFDDTDDDEDDEFTRNMLAKRQARRIRRMTSGSISKRTISERGSDSEDREDLLANCDASDLGLFRRTRRKTDRHSMQFAGQFPDIIEELKEPNSDDEIILEDAEVLARELPFWTFMDVDSE